LNEFVQSSLPSTIAGMTGLGDRPLAAFLDLVASSDPAPGAGSSTAVGAALGAALTEMCALLAGDNESGRRARELRERALQLADEDMSSYAPVLEALRMRPDHPERAARLEDALTEASRVPLAIAETAAEAAALGVGITQASSRTIRGDALTGVLIAEAAAVAAATLVEVNLAGGEDPQLALARDARRRAEEAREAALATLGRD
jgi:methenyltetrahydrofolate cyclohydrolase